HLADREDLLRQYTYLAADFASSYDTDTSAVFGQVDTAISDTFTLVSGLRLEQRRTDYRDSNGVSHRRSRDLWGARLVLEYQQPDGALYYAGVSRGYRGNGVNAGMLASVETTTDPVLQQQLARLGRFDEESLLNY